MREEEKRRKLKALWGEGQDQSSYSSHPPSISIESFSLIKLL